ncbi:hypothetical protein [Aquincola tertiaricarbonis]|uniref:hypothetical protein n=1 Tax=Aquincola tertiaricarbonis TaxID=391953 RepID=UPI0020231CBF|nr:hypothetical protein [Aquincola tertiaricarbonis]
MSDSQTRHRAHRAAKGEQYAGQQLRLFKHVQTPYVQVKVSSHLQIVSLLGAYDAGGNCDDTAQSREGLGTHARRIAVH